MISILKGKNKRKLLWSLLVMVAVFVISTAVAGAWSWGGWFRRLCPPC